MSKYDATYEYVKIKNYELYRRVIQTATVATLGIDDKAAGFRVERNIMSLVADILKGVYDKKEVREQHSSLSSGRSQDNAWKY